MRSTDLKRRADKALKALKKASAEKRPRRVRRFMDEYQVARNEYLQAVYDEFQFPI